MKAIRCNEYGGPEVMKIREVSNPQPKADEVLIKIHASQVTAGDCNIRGFSYVPKGFGIFPRLMLGFNKPRIAIQGTNLSGTIEAIGENVSIFKPGDEVFGTDIEHFGAYAEYVCWPEKAMIVKKPGNISFEEAAAIPYGALTAYYFLKFRAKVQARQKVLVHGATGGVGIYAVQLARYFGCEVTAVCRGSNFELATKLGAHKLIDYTQSDFRKNGEKYDVIFDNVLGQISFKRCKNSLKPKGKYLAIAGGTREMFQALTTSITGGKRVYFGTPPKRNSDLVLIAGLLESGQLKAIIDKQFSLEETAEAHRYFETKPKKGSVVISLMK